jgi:hypothetical protein
LCTNKIIIIGYIFVGALAYADDIVLLAPTPTAMRKLLAICDEFASEFNIVFNANKSKCLAIMPRSKRYLDVSSINFYIGGKVVESVESFAHLGHIINSKCDDYEDILHIRNSFIGQANNLLCYFGKLDMLTKIKLFKSYCTSIYGCELWLLRDSRIEEFCVTWRKALRRALNLPYNSHSYLLPLVSNSLPVFVEICKRTANFILSCLNCQSSLVSSIAWHGIINGKYNSCIGSNALFCCNYFNWLPSDFIIGNVDRQNAFFVSFCDKQLSIEQFNIANSLFEVLCIREGFSFIEDIKVSLSQKEINDIIKAIAC